MKKVFAMLLAAAWLSGSLPVLADEETEAVEVTMDMLEEAAYEGSWISFPGGFDLYLPGDWDVLEISEEGTGAGIIFQAMDPNEAGSNVVVMANEVETEYSLEMIQQELIEMKCTNMGIAVFNGIPAVYYEREETAGLAFLDHNGSMYNIQVALAEDAEEAIVQNIFCSLSLTGEAE